MHHRCAIVCLAWGKRKVALRREIEEVKQLNAAAQRAVDEASRQSRAVVHDLRQRGLSVREIGVMLGITPSRVSQLGKDKATA